MFIIRRNLSSPVGQIVLDAAGELPKEIFWWRGSVFFVSWQTLMDLPWICVVFSQESSHQICHPLWPQKPHWSSFQKGPCRSFSLKTSLTDINWAAAAPCSSENKPKLSEENQCVFHLMIDRIHFKELLYFHFILHGICPKMEESRSMIKPTMRETEESTDFWILLHTITKAKFLSILLLRSFITSSNKPQDFSWSLGLSLICSCNCLLCNYNI